MEDHRYTDAEGHGPNKKGTGRALWAMAVTALLLCAYLCLCALAGGERFWPHTYAMGVDLSGLTAAQAARTLGETLPQVMAGQTLLLREPGSGTEVTLSGADLMEPTDLEADLRAAKPGGPFLTLGGRYLLALLGRQDRDIPLTLDYTQAGRERVEGALRAVYEALGPVGGATTWQMTGDALLFTKGRSDVTVDREALRRGLADALGGTGPREVGLTLIRTPPAAPDWEALRGEVCAQVADAYYDPRTGAVVPAVTGRDLDVDKARTALEQTPEGGQCRVELVLTAPKVTTEELTALLFRDVLGEADTKASGSASRVGNVGTAAGYLNGVVVMPGEVFSYLETCGPYNAQKGYGEGLAYRDGKTVTSVGGGVCQGASTLYLALLRANLEVVSRQAHGYEPSYIPAGLDATVAGTAIDFQFRNNTDYPVKIESWMDDGKKIHVVLHGTNTTGLHGEPYTTGRVVTKYAKTVYEPNPDVPRGTTRKDPERTAYNAVTVEVWQKLVDAAGNVVDTYLLHTDSYRARDAVIFYHPDDAELWGVDPEAGRQTLAPEEERKDANDQGPWDDPEAEEL